MQRIARRGAALLAFLLALTGGAALLSLSGCGGSGTPDSGVAVRMTGRAQIAVRWPERTRLIPFASESIRVRVMRGNALQGERLLTRPAGGGLTSVLFERLPTGDVTVEAVAYPIADGSGVAQAQGMVPVTVVGGQTVTVRLTLGSTIDHVELAPGDQSLVIGQNVSFTLTARNAAGEVVLISLAKVEWTSSTGATSVVGGRVSALAAGSTAITATETESGKTASVNVQVTAPIVDPPQTTTIYDGFDYATGTLLAGLNGGTGWSGGWEANGPGSQSAIVAGSLSYPQLLTTGNAFQTASLDPTSNERRYGSLPTAPGTTRYWSLLAKPQTLSGGSPGPYFGLDIGNRFFGLPSDQGTFGICLSGNGDFTSTGLRPQVGTTYLLVIRITYGDANDTYDFYINPTPGVPLPASPNASQIRAHSTIGSEGCKFSTTLPTTFDELRVGPTWESVSPVSLSPPPTSSAVKCDSNTGHCYEKIAVAKDTTTFEQIRDAAAARTYNGRAGHLATLNSQAEVDFLSNALDLNYLKIGAYQDRTAANYSEPSGGWRWVTGEPWIYTKWNGGEPNNVGGGEDYINLYPNGSWNDCYPMDHEGYLIEYEP